MTDNGNNAVIVRYLEGETYYTIASYSHNKYNAGWSAANGKVVLPGVSSSASFTFKWPNGTVGGQSSRTYSIANNGDNAVIVRYLEGETYYTVASFTHNKYTAGQTSIRNKIGGKGTVSSNGTYYASSDGLEGYSSFTVSVSSTINTTGISGDITSGISISAGSNSKTLSMYSDTYSPRGVGGSHECVVVKDGSTIVGRYDIQSTCNSYRSAGESAGWSDGYTQGWDEGVAWANKQYKHKYTGTLYVNGTISAGNGSWYMK